MKEPKSYSAPPSRLCHLFYYVTGLFFLTLSKIKHQLRGYITPKTFDISDSDKCIAYDFRVVDQWLVGLQKVTGSSSIAGKHILELGPGSDLGIGLYLLSKGAASYSACDVHPLVYATPDSFYDRLLNAIHTRNPDADIASLRQTWLDWKHNKPSKLRYVVRNDFNLLAAFGESSTDLVFSQAAFEHFADVQSVAHQLSRLCKPNARLIVEVDLKTHSRWIRDQDPNNIYRYPPGLYRLFHFSGIPSRLRPHHYRSALKQAGWDSIAITPIKQLPSHSLAAAGMHTSYTHPENQMHYLSVLLSAHKP